MSLAFEKSQEPNRRELIETIYVKQRKMEREGNKHEAWAMHGLIIVHCFWKVTNRVHTSVLTFLTCFVYLFFVSFCAHCNFFYLFGIIIILFSTCKHRYGRVFNKSTLFQSVLNWSTHARSHARTHVRGNMVIASSIHFFHWIFSFCHHILQ